MKIAIVDDELSLLRLAKHTIEDYGKEKNIDIEVDEYLNGQSFLNSYVPDTYSMILMDVYMPELSGIDTVLKLRENDVNVSVIFLTTSEAHMKNALSCHAFDYLIKPATRADFFKVLDECISLLNIKASEKHNYITIMHKRVEINLPVDHIISISSNGHNLDIATSNDTKYNIKENFSAMAEKISGFNNMLVINRGVIVNLDYVEKIDKGNCILTDGTVFSIKIKSYASIRKIYEDYKLSN